MSNKRSIKIFVRDTSRPIYLLLFLTVVFNKWIQIDWPEDRGDLLNASLTVASVVVGFLISAMAIIISGSGRTMTRFRAMGLMLELTDTFAVAVYLALAFIAVSTSGFFGLEGRAWESAWLATGSAMGYSYIRICSLLFKLVKRD